ncbi:hypothetical protein [Yeguia hominis]|uniref:Uncharacterized protein n=1 Tax=Yeguia hominis TaxID=2763662 RepID=A0A926D8L9_9FIRM|nr:hypothetical protein [Yeguia hominis]MBC8533428.1 hypothetical protein [Yeguia hominis]
MKYSEKTKRTSFSVGCNDASFNGTLFSSGRYDLILNHGNDDPRIRFNLNCQEVKGGQTVRDLLAGLGYEMSADILYMPEWMQKLKDAGRIKFFFFARLRNPVLAEGYEAAYLHDFYVDRAGKHRVDFYWVCKSAADPDNDNFRFTGLLKDYRIIDAEVLYQTRIVFDVRMNESVSGKRYIWNVKLQQAGGEFTEATSAAHKISMHPDTLAKCYHNPTWDGIPSEWEYNSVSDAYTIALLYKTTARIRIWLGGCDGRRRSYSECAAYKGYRKINLQWFSPKSRYRPCGNAKADRCTRYAQKLPLRRRLRFYGDRIE